ncbi:MAG: hypothetical protein H8E14_14860 [Candidatus Marinimicrobia bacterium]|nr:hypothetical protein [Candidatus Neomarinimicrobiota bacterium]
MQKYGSILILLISITCAQGLFERAGIDTDDDQVTQNLDISGFVRGTSYIGNLGKNKSAELQSGYGELCLKLQADQGEKGDVFAELRFRSGHEYGNSISEFDISEAYVNAYLWKFDFRLGKQIVMWGRADGFNPTNNITPQDPTVRSPDPDDIYGANFLLRTHLNLASAWRLEGIWVPQYSASVLAFEQADLTVPPEMQAVMQSLGLGDLEIAIGDGDYPGPELQNGSLAGKLSLELSAFDGSISYAKGYNPRPGIKLGALDAENGKLIIIPAAYRQNVFGLDFSTAFKSWGLRGELALRTPENKHDNLRYYYVPYSDLYCVLGVDRMWRNFSVIAQYIGRYVYDFEELHTTADLMGLLYGDLDNYNRLFSNQTHSARHAITFRPAITLYYEALKLELFSMYDLTTDEYMLMPKISYSPADAIKFIVGANYYQGNEGTAFDLIENSFNAVFMELKISF